MIIAKDVNHIRRTHLLVFVFFLFSQFCSYLSLCAVVLQGSSLTVISVSRFTLIL